MTDISESQMQTPVSEDSFPIAEEAKQKAADVARRVPAFPQLVVAVGILVFVFGVTYIPDMFGAAGSKVKNNEPLQSVEGNTTLSGDPFDEIALEARAAYIWDVKEQRAIYNLNADQKLPLASLAKLMTTLVAYELLDRNADVRITVDAVRQDGDRGLSDGERFSLQDLTDLTLLTSSNDGAYALAATAAGTFSATNSARAFVDAMNLRAEELGLTQTHFNNTTGLDISELESGAYGTARDISFLMEYLITKNPAIVELTREGNIRIANTSGETHEVENTNKALSAISGLLASKTGYTTLAGGNLIVAFDVGLNHPIVATILGSSYDGRFSDMVKLVEATRRQYGAGF